jgi:hypothetical protein
MSYQSPFAKVIEEARARRAKIDSLRNEVIAGHVLIEGAMDEFLEASLFYPDYIKEERLNFHFKVNLALALSLKEDKDKLWKVLWSMNQLRNKVAHQLDGKDIDEKMRYLRQAFIEALEPAQKADAEKYTDAELVREASILVAGLFGQLTMDAKGRRAIIDKNWKARSESP